MAQRSMFRLPSKEGPGLEFLLPAPLQPPGKEERGMFLADAVRSLAQQRPQQGASTPEEEEEAALFVMEPSQCAVKVGRSWAAGLGRCRVGAAGQRARLWGGAGPGQQSTRLLEPPAARDAPLP